jgi:hypothetical protein
MTLYFRPEPQPNELVFYDPAVGTGGDATGEPVILGSQTVGFTLTADPGDVDDPDGINQSTIVYSWYRNDSFVSSGLTYLLTASDEGTIFYIDMDFDDNLGNPESRQSLSTGPIGPAPTPNPTQTLLPPNSSFSIYKNASLIGTQQYIGDPGTGSEEIGMWFGTTIDLSNNVRIDGTIKQITNYIKANWSYIPRTGGTMSFSGKIGESITPRVNDTHQPDDITVFVGDTTYKNKNSNHLLGSLRIMRGYAWEHMTAN